tara:strand:+ start:1563 stop:1931 length:369 start_codon:yes stop_codon:yes gene_type:complete
MMSRISLSLLVVGITASFSLVAFAQDYSNYVELPKGNWTLKDGAGTELVENYCTACHSVAPIVQHEGFDEAGWRAEIQKMQKRYGAYVDAGDIDGLAAYLTKSYGTQQPVHWSADPTDIATD